MTNIQSSVNYYTTHMQSGMMQEAYQAIMKSFVSIKQAMIKKDPSIKVGALYQGYLDMSYLPLTSPNLAAHQLKIAIVYLHKEARFEAWLSATNRLVQAKMIHRLKALDLGKYTLSKTAPGVDSIVSFTLVKSPNFDQMSELQSSIVAPVHEFMQWLEDIL